MGRRGADTAVAIHVLPPEVASRIAAGEVVERPASVVKELVENALDAGATAITVEIQGAGNALIRVVDDGEGIPAEEIEVASSRHATSKIRSEDDLLAVRTLGFRGEALPSIAAVSRLTIVSRPPAAAAGACLEVEGGVVRARRATGAAPGTTVTVRDLFFNVPARLKFLKSAAAEVGQVNRLVAQYALAYPERRFTLISDGRALLRTSGNGSLLDVLVAAYGPDVAQGMRPIEHDRPLRVMGLCSRPGLTRGSRNYQAFFLRYPGGGATRTIRNRSLAHALNEAYGVLLPRDRHPLAAIIVEVPPEQVDVNVHPSKAEVKFSREGDVYVAVQQAVRQVVVAEAGVPAVSGAALSTLANLQSDLALPAPLPAFDRTPERQPETAWLAPPVPRNFGTSPGTFDRDAEGYGLGAPGRRLSILRVIGQMGDTFVIAEGERGLYLVDQHRAHERVLYERLCSRGPTVGPRAQLLLEPLTLDLPLPVARGVLARREALAELGFEVEDFGQGTVLVRSVPAVFRKGDVVQAAREVLESAAEAPPPGDPGATEADWLDHARKMTACKAAIKAGMSQSYVEMRELLLQLEATAIPSVCPHGAPIVVHLSQEELERQFRRI